MNTFILSLVLLTSAIIAPEETPKGQSAAAAKAPKFRRIGQIFIIGNEFTKDDVILKPLGLLPGAPLYYYELALAQRRLAKLGIFKPGSVEVTAEDDPNNPDSEYKNVFVRVEETSTGSISLIPTVSCRGTPVFSLVWEERNFDPFRFPISWDDLMEGGAFRGGGQLFRLELLQIPVW